MLPRNITLFFRPTVGGEPGVHRSSFGFRVKTKYHKFRVFPCFLMNIILANAG